MSDVKNYLKESRTKEVDTTLDSLVSELESEGYEVIFGKIGLRTTYVLLKKDDDEIVGYTFLKDMKFYKENVGRLKALQQAIARKKIAEDE